MILFIFLFIFLFILFSVNLIYISFLNHQDFLNVNYYVKPLMKNKINIPVGFIKKDSMDELYIKKQERILQQKFFIFEEEDYNKIYDIIVKKDKTIQEFILFRSLKITLYSLFFWSNNLKTICNNAPHDWKMIQVVPISNLLDNEIFLRTNGIRKSVAVFINIKYYKNRTHNYISYQPCCSRLQDIKYWLDQTMNSFTVIVVYEKKKDNTFRWLKNISYPKCRILVIHKDLDETISKKKNQYEFKKFPGDLDCHQGWNYGLSYCLEDEICCLLTSSDTILYPYTFKHLNRLFSLGYKGVYGGLLYKEKPKFYSPFCSSEINPILVARKSCLQKYDSSKKSQWIENSITCFLRE